MHRTAFHHVLFPEGATAPPEWVQLVPAGTFSGADGRGPYKLTNPDAVIQASMAGGQRLPIDENHSTDLAAPSGQPSPARGWIYELQVRDGSIWGHVEWTPTGSQLMAEKAYKGQSPVFTHEKDGTVLRILRAALTNTPNLTLASLNSEGNGMDLITRLRQALGLADATDEAGVVAAVTAAVQANARHSQQLAAIAAAGGVDVSLSAEGLVTALQARAAGASDAQQLATQVVSLQTQLSTLQAERAREKAVAFVDGAIRAGKPIAPLRDHYIARHAADPAAVETEVNKLPSINAGGIPAVVLNAKGEPDGDAPTASEKTVAEKMGLDPKKLVAARKTREAGTNGGTA